MISFVYYSFRLHSNVSRPIPDPCLPLNMPLKSEDEQGRTHSYLGTGDFTQCEQSLTTLLNLTTPCQRSPCSMNGVGQPDIDYSRSPFYGFSEFWYSMEDVFRQGGRYDHNKFEQIAKVLKSKWPNGGTVLSWNRFLSLSYWAFCFVTIHLTSVPKYFNKLIIINWS